MASPFIRTICSIGALLSLSSPAAANQWVTGQVTSVAEYGGYSGAAYGVLVEIANRTWQSGSTSNGASACTGASFRVLVGQQGVTEEIKNRMWSLFLTAFAMQRSVRLYVDTGTSAPYCNVEIAELH